MQTLSIVHPASVRSLKDELYSSTALTPPTHHKGGGFGKILGIVAAIAIPFAAPAIATAIGASGAIGSALVGAGLGGLTALATVDIWAIHPLLVLVLGKLCTTQVVLVVILTLLHKLILFHKCRG